MTEPVRDSGKPPAHTLESDLSGRRELLHRRLEDGYRRIDEAAIAGADVGEWEAFWIRLLREYEGVCRNIDIAA